MKQAGQGMRFWKDALFWLALLAGPLSWLLLASLGLPQRTAPPSLQTLALVIVASPILEEIVFRGGLQAWLLTRPSLQRSIAGISLANILASLVFTALHLVRHPPLWAAPVFLPSLAFGWAMERHQTLLSPILLHAFYNAGFLWLFAQA